MPDQSLELATLILWMNKLYLVLDPSVCVCECVASFKSLNKTGNACIWHVLNKLASVEDTQDWSPVSGRRDRASAFPWCKLGLNSMSYEYAESRIAHLCNHAAAKVGTPVLGPKIDKRGLWSVIKVNLRPNKYKWNLQISYTRAKAPSHGHSFSQQLKEFWMHMPQDVQSHPVTYERSQLLLHMQKHQLPTSRGELDYNV